MKRFAFLLPLLLSLVLSACVPRETTDIVSFCAGTKSETTDALSLTDCVLAHEDGEYRFFWQCGQGLAVRVFCTEDGRVKGCRVLLQRMREDGSDFLLTPRRIEAFTELSARVCGGLNEVSARETLEMMQTLELKEQKTFEAPGRSVLFSGEGFFARLNNNDGESVLYISNKWLSPQEENETPESVPAFDETTNIRTETVPLS